MKIAAGVLTFNHFATGRADDFRRTIASIRAAAVPFTVVTNGSTDGTENVVREMGGIVDDADSRIWYGMQLAIEWAIAQGAEIVLFTADDIEYRPGWAEKAAAFWAAAPADVLLASLMVEPVYGWNTISAMVEHGGIRAVLRESVGGCCWTFRAADWDRIGPIPQIMPGEDLAICHRLRGRGYQIAALDLADHIGEKHSAWGNQSWQMAQALPADVLAWMEAK